MWVNTEDLPTSDGHPFFERLNRVLEESGFDAFVEGLCEAFYACRLGRPSLRPGRYFRLLFIGYFEGVSSERGIAWRVADSLSLRSFLDLDMTEAAPDHSTLSRTRRRIDVETHEAVFTWVLERVAEAGLVRGKTVGIDATIIKSKLVLPKIHLVAKNRLTQYINAAKSYIAVLSGITSDLAGIVKDSPKHFTFSSIDSGMLEIRDFQTSGVVAFARGTPFITMKSGTLSVAGQRVKVNAQQLEQNQAVVKKLATKLWAT